MQPTPHSDDLFPDCGRVQSELAGLVYDELPPDARAALERHLEGCAACREELAGLRDTRALLARWETPASGEDPRVLARAIAAEARGQAPQRARRARLVRWSARVSGVAAALLFVLSLLQAQMSVSEGRFALSFGLPGSGAPAPERGAGSGALRDEMRAIAAEEVALRTASLEQRCSQMTREELLRLSQAVDFALARSQENWDARLIHLGEEARRADLETRRVLTDLASYLPVPDIRR